MFAANTLTGTGVRPALVAQDPYNVGELGVRYPTQDLEGKRASRKHSVTGEAIITTDNVGSDAMKK